MARALVGRGAGAGGDMMRARCAGGTMMRARTLSAGARERTGAGRAAIGRREASHAQRSVWTALMGRVDIGRVALRCVALERVALGCAVINHERPVRGGAQEAQTQPRRLVDAAVADIAAPGLAGCGC
jgi:hypothetical protein